MTLEEAIALLQERLDEDEERWNTEGQAALRLGIEAMKRIDSDRHQVVPLFLIKLPGETTD